MFGNLGNNFRAPKVDVHQFAMIPRAEIPRSSFRMQSQHKTTISASVLLPVYLQEVLPGDSWNVDVTCVARLAPLVYPIMDQVDLEWFFFFVPNRLIWVHWPNFCGEQNNPGDSTSYTIPQVVSPVGGFAQLSIFDYFGLPCAGQTAAGNTISVSALPFRAYNLIVQEWFRDENLANARATGSVGALVAGAKWICQSDDGPDPVANYGLFTAAKRHDYFTSCLPFTQKGATVPLPLQGTANIKGLGFLSSISAAAQTSVGVHESSGLAQTYPFAWESQSASYSIVAQATAAGGGTNQIPAVFADLSTASATTINALRLAFQTQRLLERDARGGTRYTELIRAHFGVMSPDARLMRPEYLGGGRQPINVAAVPQTTATGLTGGSSPLGTLTGVGTATSRIGFRQSFTEHGYIIGLVCARRNQVYQQGIRRLWSRLTRYDFYWPAFAMLGEQAVNNIEIYSDGSANDAVVFGYQERWAEYRYHPSFTSAYFRSTTTTPLDTWHLAEKYASVPSLNGTFITDETNVVLNRVLAAGAASGGQQILMDMVFDQKAARPMPVYSVPGLIDHF